MTNLFGARGFDLKSQKHYVIIATDSRLSSSTDEGKTIVPLDSEYQKLHYRNGVLLCGTGYKSRLDEVFSTFHQLQKSKERLIHAEDISDWVMDLTAERFKEMNENDSLNFLIGGIGKDSALLMTHANTTGNRAHLNKGKDFDSRDWLPFTFAYDGAGSENYLQAIRSDPCYPRSCTDIGIALDYAKENLMAGSAHQSVDKILQLGVITRSDDVISTRLLYPMSFLDSAHMKNKDLLQSGSPFGGTIYSFYEDRNGLDSALKRIAAEVRFPNNERNL